MKRWFILPLSLMLVTASFQSYAALDRDQLRKADLALINKMHLWNPDKSFERDKKYFFQDSEPQVAYQEKTIAEILSMPATLNGVISVDKVLASQVKTGKAYALSESAYIAKLRSSFADSKDRATPTPKNWTFVAEHSRVGSSK